MPAVITDFDFPWSLIFTFFAFKQVLKFSLTCKNARRVTEHVWNSGEYGVMKLLHGLTINTLAVMEANLLLAISPYRVFPLHFRYIQRYTMEFTLQDNFLFYSNNEEIRFTGILRVKICEGKVVILLEINRHHDDTIYSSASRVCENPIFTTRVRSREHFLRIMNKNWEMMSSKEVQTTRKRLRNPVKLGTD